MEAEKIATQRISASRASALYTLIWEVKVRSIFDFPEIINEGRPWLDTTLPEFLYSMVIASSGVRAPAPKWR